MRTNLQKEILANSNDIIWSSHLTPNIAGPSSTCFNVEMNINSATLTVKAITSFNHYKLLIDLHALCYY